MAEEVLEHGPGRQQRKIDFPEEVMGPMEYKHWCAVDYKNGLSQSPITLKYDC